MSHFLLGPLSIFLFLSIIIFIISFISKRKHLLTTLLSLEGLMLMLFGLIYFLSISHLTFLNFILVFLTLTACEGALGLSLLVVIVRTYGSDHFNSLNFLQC